MDDRVPAMMYGTAWKEAETTRLVGLALEAGFRGIDTANQRRHYNEAGVGEALQTAFAGGLDRDDLFLQTKFTYVSGQDHRLPYDAHAPPARQVEQSFESSLEHLGTDHLDAYLLHGPSTGEGLGEVDWETWRAMEDVQRSGRARLLGLSNVTPRQLLELHKGANVKPRVVQNRCFTRPQADLEVRAFCAGHGIAYEGFSLLTAIPTVLRHPVLRDLAAGQGKTEAQVLLAYCLQRGMVVLTGTTDPKHMEQDLQAGGLALSSVGLGTIDALLGVPLSAPQRTGQPQAS